VAVANRVNDKRTCASPGQQSAVGSYRFGTNTARCDGHNKKPMATTTPSNHDIAHERQRRH